MLLTGLGLIGFMARRKVCWSKHALGIIVVSGQMPRAAFAGVSGVYLLYPEQRTRSIRLVELI